MNSQRFLAGQCHRRLRCVLADQHNPRPLDAFASGVVEQHRVSIGLPNCDQLDASGPMYAELNATGSASSNNVALRHLSSGRVQLVLFADSLLNVASQIV